MLAFELVLCWDDGLGTELATEPEMEDSWLGAAVRAPWLPCGNSLELGIVTGDREWEGVCDWE